MKIRRIAFTGPSGTGKTVLAKQLEQQLGIPFNPIGSRTVAKEMGFSNPYDVDQAGRRKEFQERLLGAKIAWETENQSFVTDRSTFDNLSYDTLHDPKAADPVSIERAIAQAQSYTHVFFCSAQSFINVQSDPIRIQNLAYHDMYEALLMGLHIKYGVKFIKIPYGELEQRHQFVRSLT